VDYAAPLDDDGGAVQYALDFGPPAPAAGLDWDPAEYVTRLDHLGDLGDLDADLPGDEADLDVLLAEAEDAAAEEVTRFNPYHAPAGPGGGQFATAAGSGTPAGAPARAAEQRQLRQQANGLRAQAARLQARLGGLLKQMRAQVAAHKKSVASARHAHAVAAKTTALAKHHRTVKARRRAAKAHHRAAVSLATQIRTLRTRIRALRSQAAALDARAAKL
jgi:hypothetical protein